MRPVEPWRGWIGTTARSGKDHPSMSPSPRCAGRFRALFAGIGLILAPPALAQNAKWDSIPTMQLEGLYRGPLRDTVVQRWRDPIDGTICYLFIPINAPHSPPNETGYVQYGPNTIGSVSCVGPAGKTPPAPQAAARPARPGAPPAARAAAPAVRARPPRAEKPPAALATPPSEALPEPKSPTSE